MMQSISRKEAIKILKDLSDCSHIGSLASEDIEALNMAIQALEQEPTTKNDLAVSSELDKNSKKLEKDFGESDCISRKAILDELEKWDWQELYLPIHFKQILDELPTVTPQEPKAGHWIKGYTFPDGAYWKCDKCNELIKVKIPMRYCNNCGAKMVEPQESEG